MYIKLIQPLMHRRSMDTDIKNRMSPPLGLYTIVQMFRNEHRVEVENENVRPIDFTDSPDIVGISVNVDSLPRAMEISAEFRSRGIPVVAGGILVTTAWDFIPEDVFDVLCIGAAEGTWRDIVEDLQNGKLQRIYRCSHALKGEDIVPPAYDLIDRKDYLYTNIFHTSRGCLFRCDFCYNSTPERFYVNRSIEDVVREVKTAKIGHVMFIDDNFVGNPRWTRRLLPELKRLGLYDTAHVVMQPKNMTVEELYEGYLRVYKEVYSYRNILRRMPRSVKQIPAYLMFNLFYRKWGRFTDWLCKKITYERIGYWGEKLGKYI